MSEIDRHVERERRHASCSDCGHEISWWQYRGRKLIDLVRCSACAARLWYRVAAQAAGRVLH